MTHDTQLLEQLHNFKQRDVAIGLSDLFIEKEPNEKVREALEKVRNIAWNARDIAANGTYERDANRRAVNDEAVRAIAKELGEDDRKKLVEDFVKLGHLYEIAGHLARDNFFDDRRKQLQEFTEQRANETDPKNKLAPANIMVPAGINELLEHNENVSAIKDVGEVIKLLNKPESEFVFTQHPTNTNTLEAMKLQRQIAKDADALVHAKDEDKEAQTKALDALNKSLTEFVEKDVVSPNNFTSYDETSIVLNFLSNAFDDLDRTYAALDKGLKRKFPDEYDFEKQMELDLKLRFGSWGSAGDKDGNKNIKSENTLEAIVLHKKTAAELFMKATDNVPALAPWHEKLKAAKEKFAEIEREIETVRKGGNDIPLTSQQFSDLSKEIVAASNELGSVNDMRGAIREAMGGADDAQKKALLSIDRKLRIFGFNMGKIEYRETAEEYSRVVNFLMKTQEARAAFGDAIVDRFAATYDKDNKTTDETERTETLSEILGSDDSKGKLVEVARAFMKHAEQHPKNLRNYANDEAIAYHSLRRMELARDFDNMITHNVLAECQGTHNLLEALALQVATTTNAGNRAMLHIVPLFEEAETMANIPKILLHALDPLHELSAEARKNLSEQEIEFSNIYREHLHALQAREGTKELTQQIQIAHSDNARRAGAIASRGIIHEGHRTALKAIDEYNAQNPDAKVNLEFFEGGSFSDSYRNGVRAATAMIYDFGLKDKFKATLQGGDLLNYFNESSSMERFVLRGLVQQAEMQFNGKSNGSELSEKEKIAVGKGLSNLQKQYDAVVYEKPGNPLGKLMCYFGYLEEIAAGNAGTRAGARQETKTGFHLLDTLRKGFGAVLQAMHLQPEEVRKTEVENGIDPSKIRTIGFSEFFQHLGIHPTFFGAGEIKNQLLDSFREQKWAAPDWRDLYKRSPAFRDAIDKLAYSVINSDVQKVGKQINRFCNQNLKEIDKQLSGNVSLETREALEQQRDNLKQILQFGNIELASQYIEASKMVLEAMPVDEKTAERIKQGIPYIESYQGHTGRLGEKITKNGLEEASGNILDAAARAKYLVKSLPDMARYEMHFHKSNYVDALDILAQEAGMVHERVTHNGRDTVCHGRNFGGDDPNYAREWMAWREADRSRQVAA